MVKLSKRVITISICGLLAAALGACSSNASRKSTTNADLIVAGSQQNVPGAVQFVWEEPMVDVIDVPPGLDPEGHYYRPAHQSIVEIRQGRWKYYPQP